MKKIILIVLTVITLMLSACSNAAVVKEKPVSFSDGNTEITTKVTVPSTMKAVTKEMTTELKTTVTTTKKDEQTVTQNTTTQKSTTTKKQTTTKKAEKTTKKTEKTTKEPTTTKKKKTTTKKKQTTTKAKTCTNNGNHSLSCGNMGRWFNSKSEVKAYVDKEMKYWADLEESGKITREEYYKKCPSGYECWSCSYCGKWTGNFKY